jgi:hypothetical protein
MTNLPSNDEITRFDGTSTPLVMASAAFVTSYLGIECAVQNQVVTHFYTPLLVLCKTWLLPTINCSK